MKHEPIEDNQQISINIDLPAANYTQSFDIGGGEVADGEQVFFQIDAAPENNYPTLASESMYEDFIATEDFELTTIDIAVRTLAAVADVKIKLYENDNLVAESEPVQLDSAFDNSQISFEFAGAININTGSTYRVEITPDSEIYPSITNGVVWYQISGIIY